ncbi:hypothetical protein KKF05_02555 [Patescibacteria group bacterium]|nr:hypothetical protein [Patescibacteria group bacterium]MBU1029281.1 hypothetical protein [Patescibacteria group bacterium]MBU1915878.1 hypothetical protein [Patescibacteria group bacterium]
MALVFAGIVTHTPVLMPNIGQDAIKLIDKTKTSMERLGQQLQTAKPDILVMISPHGEVLPDAVSINLNSRYDSRFDEFGDLTTKKTWRPATMLIDRFREDFKRYDLPLALVSDEYLDYGTSVPLCYLTENLPHIKIVPMHPSSQLSVETHFKIGQALRSEIDSSTSRIAVLASADLSHRVGENSPEGLSPKGIAFDEKVQEILRDKNPVGFLDVDQAWIKEAGSCSAMVLAILFGLLDGIQHESEILSYEKPLGVGYLVATIHLS